MTTPDDFGALLRRARQARAISQLRLSQLCGVSQRYLSFLETGKAHPSRAMVLALADVLAVAPVLRNRMLLAARHAPLAGGGPQVPEIDALASLLDGIGAVAAVIIDAGWDIQRMNPAFEALVAEFVTPESVWPAIAAAGGRPNLLRLFGAAEGLCPYLENGAELRMRMLDRLSAELDAGQPQLAGPLAEIGAMPKPNLDPGKALTELRLRNGERRRRYRAMVLQLDAGTMLPWRIVSFVPLDPDTHAASPDSSKASDG